jgi:hypothetical protein
MPTAIKALLERPPMGWLRERDVDLLLCSELHAGGVLVELIARKLDLPQADFAGAWVSHAEAEGETDIMVAFRTTEGHALALIENKIGAPFQPEQAERYRERRDRWRATDGVTFVVALLLAPAAYMSRPGCELFDQCISYEETCAALRAASDRRSRFLAGVLEAGIEAYRRGYVMVPDDAASSVWVAAWRIAADIAPSLNFVRPTTKPGKSTWFYVRDAEGFSQEDRRKVVVVYKAERGQVDLQFANTPAAVLERRAKDVIEPDMVVVPAAKAASIRINVPDISFAASPSGQEARIAEGLRACERLRAFYLQHRNTLLGG